MTIDLLKLAGGRDGILRTVHGAGTPYHHAAKAVVELICQQAQSALHAELKGEVENERELQVFMAGDRPQAPSDDADAWDEAFEAAMMPVFEKFAARAEVPQDWIVAALSGNIVDDAENLDALASATAEHMVKYRLRKTQGTIGRQLSAIGLVQNDISDAYALLNGNKRAPVPEPDGGDALAKVLAFTDACGFAPSGVAAPAAEPTCKQCGGSGFATQGSGYGDVCGECGGQSFGPAAEERYDFMSLFDEATGEFAEPAPDAHSGPVAPPSTAPAQPSTQAADAARSKRARGHGPSKTCVLPGEVFKAIRALGVSDKEASGCVGIARSTWARVAGGDAEEIGLKPEQAAGLAAYVNGLRKRVEDLATLCELNGLTLEAERAAS